MKTPRTVDVAFYYEDVVRGICREATSEVARLRSSRAEYRERGFVEEFTEVRIRRSDVANACRLRDSVQLIYRETLVTIYCKKTLT